jgi:hypothetical protein
MAYLISHLFFPTIPKAFRPRSSVLVLTIPILVSKQFFLFLKRWYSRLIDFSMVVFALIPAMAEPPELLQLKYPSHALEAVGGLLRRRRSFKKKHLRKISTKANIARRYTPKLPFRDLRHSDMP